MYEALDFYVRDTEKLRDFTQLLVSFIEHIGSDLVHYWTLDQNHALI